MGLCLLCLHVINLDINGPHMIKARSLISFLLLLMSHLQAREAVTEKTCREYRESRLALCID